MRVRKVKSDDVKIHDSVQVKLKTSGNTQVCSLRLELTNPAQSVIFPKTPTLILRLEK